MVITERSYIAPHKRALHQSALKILLIVQFATVLPFMAYLPKWLLVVFGLVVFWRWRVLHGRLVRPPRSLVLLAMITGILGLLVSGLNQYTLDSAVALCVLGYLLKSLEVLRRRDGVVQIYLGYFLTGVFLLYRFDPLAALIMVFLLGLNSLALQAITAGVHFRWSYGIRQTSFLILAAIPVMVAGYLFFPRLPPLWSIPNSERGAVTGMTDEFSPGSIADLAQSTEPVFRVSFTGDIPPRNEWYWRGNTMSLLDGDRWKAKYTESNRMRWPLGGQLPTSQSTEYSYSVILENTGRHWLYLLDWPVSMTLQGSVILPDGRAAYRSPISSPLRYQAVSSNEVAWAQQDAILSENRILPKKGNDALRQWAVDNRQRVETDGQFVDWLLNYIRSEEFYYTLRPPLYESKNGIADFWLGDRRGFCGHYASAVTFLLRSVGIPARLVGGYLGGTYNSNGNYIQVRQMEAHVWVEVWLEGRWVRVDPTLAVAPNRVEQNLDSLFSESQPGELPLISRIQSLGGFSAMMMTWDSLVYRWQVLVLDYDNETAISWFEASLGRFTPIKAALSFLTLLSVIAVIMGVVLGLIRVPTRRVEPHRSLFDIQRHFGPRGKEETIRQYFTRLSNDYPTQAGFIEVSLLIERRLYSSQEKDARALKPAVKTLIRQHAKISH